MVIKLNFIDDLLKYEKNYMEIITEVMKIIDLTIFEHFGIIIQQSQDEILVTWEDNHNLRGKALNNTLHSYSSVKQSVNTNFGFQLNNNLNNKYNDDISINDRSLEGMENESFSSSNKTTSELEELREIKEEIKQMYNSYELSSESQNETSEDDNILQKLDNLNFNINIIFNLALISAIKICSRILYSDVLFDTFQQKYQEMEEEMLGLGIKGKNNNNGKGNSKKQKEKQQQLKTLNTLRTLNTMKSLTNIQNIHPMDFFNQEFNPIQISFKQGFFKHLILNTENLVNTAYVGKDVSKAYNLIVSFI